MFAPWMQKLSAAAKADPGKASVLAVLVVIMGVLWVRLMPGGGQVPQSVSAAATPVVGALPEHIADSRVVEVSHVEQLHDWTRQPVRGIGRNLFAIQLAYYPREGGNGVATQESAGFWEELEKSRSRQTDQKKARQVLLENLQLQAAQIKLQSTMMSGRPQAMVNGELVAEGGVVTVGPGENRVEFRVLRIEARSMIVEREGIKLAIQMK